MSNWIDRLKSKMKELNLTQEELAQKLGVTRSAVAHYVQGTRHPPVTQIIKLAAVLKTDPAWLQFGKTNETQTKSTKQVKSSSLQIPVLDWHQALDFGFDISQSAKEYLKCFHPNCYALMIKSDSMISPLGQGESFDQGSYIIVDPSKSPTHNNYVLAISTNKKEAIMRQYIEEGGIFYLKPLNPQYPLIQVERHVKVLGVVIANIKYL